MNKLCLNDKTEKQQQIGGLVQKDKTPLLTHWSYVFLALTDQYINHK